MLKFVLFLLIENESNGVRTRGKTQATPIQWTKVPVLVKIFKLVVYELGHYLEATSAEQDIEVILFFLDLHLSDY